MASAKAWATAVAVTGLQMLLVITLVALVALLLEMAVSAVDTALLAAAFAAIVALNRHWRTMVKRAVANAKVAAPPEYVFVLSEATACAPAKACVTLE